MGDNILTRLKFKCSLTHQPMTTLKAIILVLSWSFVSLNSFSQVKIGNSDCVPPATVILFRTFNIFSYTFSYKLFSGDSLLGRIKTHDVIILETYDQGISFHATAKAPSLNADKRKNYQKRKTINYPFALQQGHVYFVKCGFLNQSLFEYPRQPTIRLIKSDEIGKYIKKRFLRKKIKMYLYKEWLMGKNLDK
jgi:hypothetical protein